MGSVKTYYLLADKMNGIFRLKNGRHSIAIFNCFNMIPKTVKSLTTTSVAVISQASVVNAGFASFGNLNL